MTIKSLLISILIFLSVPVYADIHISNNNVSIKTTEYNDIVVPKTFSDVDDIDIWNNLAKTLRDPDTFGQTFTLEVQGTGGAVDVLTNVTAAVQYAQSKGTIVNMNVIGPAYSAHAFLICYANHVTFNPEGNLMFHNMKSWGEIGPIDVVSNSMDNNMSLLQQAVLTKCVRNNILTKQQSIDIINKIEVTIASDRTVTETPDRFGILFIIESFLVNISKYIFMLVLLYMLIRVARKAWKV